jgi:hypothetical protein
MCLMVNYKKKVNFFSLLKVTEESDLELDPDPDPLVRGMGPRIRIHTKMSRIPNTGFRSVIVIYTCRNPGIGSWSPAWRRGEQLAGTMQSQRPRRCIPVGKPLAVMVSDPKHFRILSLCQCCGSGPAFQVNPDPDPQHWFV